MIRSRVTFAITEAAEMHAATRSPFHMARPGTSSPSTGNPSVSTYAGPQLEPGQRAAQRLDVGDVHAEPVALPGLDDHHRPGQGPAQHLLVAALTRLGGEQLGVGQARDDAGLALGQDRRRCDQRARRRRRGPPRRRPAIGASPARRSARS